MGNANEDESPQAVSRRTLRAVNLVSGFCSLVLNTTTLVCALTGMFSGNSVPDLTSVAYLPVIISIAWNLLEPGLQRALPAEHKWITVLGDVGLFFGFLAMLIASGIIHHNLGWLDPSEAMLLMYNNMPWMVCVLLHLFFIFQVSMDILQSRPGWENSPFFQRWQGKFPTLRSLKKDGTTYSLLQDEEEEEDEEQDGPEESSSRASHHGKAPVRVVDQV